MMYVGMWRSFFPFHTEDVNMFSINVLHVGAPKFWYGVPPAETKRVENLARSTWPEEKCHELMRHKTKLFSPMRLKQAGISFVRGVQQKGEIMITWPSSFHGGFNAGFNVAEAVNFVPESLLEFYLGFARQAGFCKCRPDSVMLDIDWLEAQIKLLHSGELVVSNESPEKKKARKPQQKKQKKDRLRPFPLEIKVGEYLELKIESSLGEVWLPVAVSQIVDGSARLHEKGTPKASDVWLSLRSERLRLPGQDEAEPNKRQKEIDISTLPELPLVELVTPLEVRAGEPVFLDAE
jgi:hypothetical protein